MRPILVALALGLKLTTAFAADQWIVGRQLLVQAPSRPDRRRVAVDAMEWGSPDSVVGEPTVAGATLTIRADGDNPTQQTFPLPQGTALNGKPFWAGSSTKGFKYKDPKGEQGPVGSVQIRKTSSGLFLIKVRASARYAPLSIVPPDPGTGGCMLLELGDGDSYSVAFPTGTIKNKGATFFKVTWPLTQGTCVTLLPTTTSTSTTTNTTTTSTTSTTTSTTSTTTSTTSTTTSTTSTTTSTTSTTTSTTSTTTSTTSTTAPTTSTTTSTTSTIASTTSTIVSTTSTTASTTSTTTSTTSTTATTSTAPCNPDSESYSEPAFYRSLAYRWAPIIMQDTAAKWNADFIGRVDYDNDWRGNDNWDNLPGAGIAPYIYYDVLETPTHWFIGYHTFHPRDWDDVFFGTCGPFSDCHENDTENLFMVIQKDGSTYGRFRVMETEAHTSFYQYALANDGVSNGTGPDADDIDDDPERGFSLFVDTSVGVNDPRPAIYIESKGHGICDWWDNNGPYCIHPDDKVGSSGNDGVMYYPSATAVPTVPSNPNGGQWYNFKYPYQLISLWDDVWVLRSCLGNGMAFDGPFTYPGVSGNGSPYIGNAMDGDDYAADAGTAWWAQAHGNLAPGDWTMDPASTVLRQLTFAESVDRNYIFNPFFGIH
jgi:hypothetical protein